MREWLYYNFAALSVFTQRNVVADFVRLKSTFGSKNERIAFWATLSGLGSNVRTPSIARWKAHGRPSIRHNWFFYAISYGCDIISGNLLKSAFFGLLSANIWQGRGHRPPTSVGVINQSDCHFVWYQNIRSASFRFVTIHASDRQTDRQNCDSSTVRCVTWRTVENHITFTHTVKGK